MRALRQAISLCFLALSVLIAWMAWRLKFYFGDEVGPGLMPFGAALLLGGVSALGLVQGAMRPGPPTPTDFVPSRVGLLRIVAIAGATAAAIALLEPLGFTITTFGYLMFLLVVVGGRRPITAVALAAAGSAGVYAVFTTWLHVSLPAGPFGF